VDDPTGHTMEATVLGMGIESSALGVTIRGATIEKVAWNGLKTTGPAWTIEDNEIRYAHSIGLRLSGDGHLVRRNYIHHSGTTGIVATRGSGNILESNHVAFNNYLHFGHRPNPHEEGGAKFLFTPNTTLRGNYSHDNDGDGWWFDTGNTNVLVDGNVFENNTRYGFFYEASSDAVIRNNTFRNNGIPGRVTPAWIGTGIRVATSTNVEVHHNLFDDNKWSSLSVNWQDRPGGGQTTGLYVHDNTFHMTEGWVGASEGESDIGDGSSNNRFRNNHYYVSDPAEEWWRWPSSGRFEKLTWEEWRSLGFDVSGSLSRGPPTRPTIPPAGEPLPRAEPPASPSGTTIALLAAAVVGLAIVAYAIGRRRRA
jgi:parallel beta-helix repeat protein